MSRPPLLTRIPDAIAAVPDYAAYARERLDPAIWAYLDGAAGDELSARWNREAWERLRLHGRVLADVAGGDTALTLFGSRLEHPVLLAPVAYQRLAHPDGELAAARAAAALGAGFVLSTLASVELEAVAALPDAPPLWFQLYCQPERAASVELVQRAEAAGYSALVVTVDAPLAGIRNRERRAGFRLPPGVSAANLRHGQTPFAPGSAQASLVFDGIMRTAPTWRELDWLLDQTRLPVILKGIVSPEDAALAIERGVAGLIVSNHGGRVLDTLPASAEVLPAIAERVAGRVPILVDGGIRRGTDVLKALALGASAVLIGRPYLHGLAAAGALGVAHVLKMLREELEVAMALTGCARLADIGPGVLWRP